MRLLQCLLVGKPRWTTCSTLELLPSSKRNCCKKSKKLSVWQYHLMNPSAKTFRVGRWTSLCTTSMKTNVCLGTLTQFMGHKTAKDLLENLKSTLSKLNNRKLLKISINGPRLNWKLLSLPNEDRQKEDADLPQLLNVGSCGLHVVHGDFCTGCQSTESVDQSESVYWK